MQEQLDVVCHTLVGRDPQIAAVRRVLARAREGNGQVALIVGEAGVGKSRLLRAMTEEARAAGFFVLHGACFEAERSIPYAPLLDLVRLFAASRYSPSSGRSCPTLPQIQRWIPNWTGGDCFTRSARS